MRGVLALDELLKIIYSLFEFFYWIRNVCIAAASGLLAIISVAITFRIVGVSI
jgi:hypothetical protein